MGDIGEYWNEHREKDQKRKADQLKWNTDILYWAKEEYGFKLVKHTDFHYSIYHPQKGRCDFWPSTGRISWFNKSKPGRPHSAKVIHDIEAYLMKHFNPQQK